MENKIKGSIFGFTIGNSLGYTTEFMTKKQIQEGYDFNKEKVSEEFYYNRKKGETTEDTDMLIALTKGILKDFENPISSIGEEFINWYKNSPKNTDIITKQAIHLQTELKNWERSSERTHQILKQKTASNGSLMRTLPISFLYKNKEDIEKMAIAQSKMTHYDNLAAEACVIYNFIAFDILQGEKLKESIRKNIEKSDYSSILYLKPPCESDEFVFNTLRWTLYILLNSNTYEESIQKAIELEGDTDTIAALVGGISGLYYGYDTIPSRFIEPISLKEELFKLCEEVINFSSRD